MPYLLWKGKRLVYKGRALLWRGLSRLPVNEWPHGSAPILFEGYTLSWLPTADASTSIGKVKEDRTPLRRYAICRREFAFDVHVNSLSLFEDWLDAVDGQTFDWTDLENVGGSDTVKVRLAGGKSGVRFGVPEEGHFEQVAPTPQALGWPWMRGQAILESNEPIPSPNNTGWPVTIAAPLWSRAYRIEHVSSVRRTALDDGAVRQSIAVKPVEQRTIQFDFDLLASNLDTFLRWLYGSDDRDLTVPVPEGGTASCRLVGGMAGVRLTGDGQRTEDGLIWHGSATVRTT